MILLYHGGTDKVARPVCKFGRPYLDFGPGFYLTDIRQQAVDWAKRQAVDRRLNPMLNVYSFKQEEAIVRYRYLRFEAYDEAWLDFIVDCRQGRDVWLDYDIVEGGVANDRVIDTVELYTLGFLGKSEALGRLSEHQPNSQICILSQEVIEEYLEFLRAEEL